MIDLDDTIVAIASPTTPAVRGIVRLSGPSVVGILQQLGLQIDAQRGSHWLTADIDVGEPLGAIPTRVMLWPTSRSYTGQPSAELHSLGSLPLLRALVDATLSAGARAARPGEYTMRAFLAGRLDLLQAEAVLGVIEAQQRGSLDHALRQLAGNLSRPLERMRGEILDLLADVEAGLDFVDEDIEFITDSALVNRLSEIANQLNQARRLLRERGSDTAHFVVAVRGEPNAGKSQLVNALADRQAAIVAHLAGTTRDVVTIETNIGGHPVTLVDTAGIEDNVEAGAAAEISRQSQVHATRASEAANIRLWCVDTARIDFVEARARLEQVAHDDRRSAMDVWVGTKIDQQSNVELPTGWLATSSATGAGIDALRDRIARLVEQRDREEVGSVIGTAARCRGSLQLAAATIATAIRMTEAGDGHEFVAAELRTACQCLGEVTGTVYTDDLLDRVFGRFCIGK